MSPSRRAVAIVVALAAFATGCGGGGGEALKPVQATPSGRSIFSDDLSSNQSGWTEVGEPGLSIVLSVGELVVTTAREGSPVAVVPEAIDVDLFETEVAATLPEGAVIGPGSVGVLCRSTNDDFYAFTIDDQGTAAISLWRDGERTILGSSSYKEVPRRVAGRCLGGIEGGPATLRLVLDGREVVVATDETALGSGAAGMFASASSSEPLAATFVRFEVREMPEGTTHLAPPEPFVELSSEGFTDDFSGDDGPFGELLIEDEFGGFLAEYDAGTYRMRADGFVQRSAPVEPLPDRAEAEVLVTRVSDGPSFRGLRWALDEDRYYEVAIDDGVAIIGYVDGDRDAFVELDRVDAVTAVEASPTPNRIRTELERVPDQSVRITLSVNGTAVAEATDDDRFGPLSFSQLFMRSTSESTEITEVRFDDYVLRGL